MMRCVLISIKPKWCELIACGKKTIEVRKNKPKLEPPFKCYIYETKTKGHYSGFHENTTGKVIGEFVCDRILDILISCVDPDIKGLPFPCTGLTDMEIMDYLGNGVTGYGWHISDLVIYDKPKELSEFRKPCKFAYSSYEEGICYEDCIQGKLENCINFCLPITRPPQSWCYVENLGE